MNRYDVASEEYKTKMGRFFNPMNLDRYRKLASDEIDDSERQRVFDVFANELRAFKREVTRSPTEKRPPDSVSRTR